MNRARLLVSSIVVAALLSLGSCRSTEHRASEAGSWQGATILISLDGFRWDYRDHYPAPTLDGLAERGVVANLRPPFPSKTFPSHHTIATGLWPNRHGVVGNSMYDPTNDVRFSMGNKDAVADGSWWGGEPIWVTSEKNGLLAGAFFWPGTAAEIDSVRPAYWVPYSDTVANQVRVDQILEWLDLPRDRRPSFMTLYFSDVDGAGHRYGPESEQTGAAVAEVDLQIGMLVDRLRAKDLLDRVNIVVVSDHGMSQLSRDRVIYLDDYVDVSRAGILSLGQYVSLWPKPPDVDEIFESIHGAHSALTVYRRGSIPERFHLDGHPRTPPIVGVVEEGWSVSTHEWVANREFAFTGGGHGYDNQVANMNGIFIASGPSFRSGVTAGKIDAVDIYNLLVRSLEVEPAENQGNTEVLEEILEH